VKYDAFKKCCHLDFLQVYQISFNKKQPYDSRPKSDFILRDL